MKTLFAATLVAIAFLASPMQSYAQELDTTYCYGKSQCILLIWKGELPSGAVKACSTIILSSEPLHTPQLAPYIEKCRPWLPLYLAAIDAPDSR